MTDKHICLLSSSEEDPGLKGDPDLLLMNLEGGDYGFWVNGSVLISFTAHRETRPGSPKSPFPFTRLAGTRKDNDTSLFIYHQLNASTFAEEQWDITEGGWISNTFTVRMA